MIALALRSAAVLKALAAFAVCVPLAACRLAPAPAGLWQPPATAPGIASPHRDSHRDSAPEVRGAVTFAVPAGPSYSVQADLAEVADRATVSLIDAVEGNTVSSSVTDENGAFVLRFRDFEPQAGGVYVLEAVKGLAVGGNPNRAGAAMVRVRSLLLWQDGWKSLTNTTPGVGIRVSPATTAVAAIVSLRQAAGDTIALGSLIGKVNGSAFSDAGTGLDGTVDFAPVLTYISNALTLDQDPISSIAYDGPTRRYRLTTGPALVRAFFQSIVAPGSTMVVRGAHFDPNPGRITPFFGGVPAATWTVSVDRASMDITVPAGAYSAPVTLMQPGGIRQSLVNFLYLTGTVGTYAGGATRVVRDGVGEQAGIDTPFGLVRDTSGNLYYVDVQQTPRVYRIRKVASDRTVTTFAGSSSRCTASELAASPDACSADGTGTAANFYQPENLAMDPDGATLYVSDEGAGRIRKIDLATAEVTTLRSPGGAVLTFSQCTGVSVDSAKNVYVVEYSNRRILKVTPQGAVSTVANLPTPSFGLRMNADGSGGYVSLYATHQIGRLTPASGGQYTVSVLAGSGQLGSADGGPSAASFYYPVTIEPDVDGSLLVADTLNNRIRRVSATGLVSTLAGSAKSFKDGAAGEALFGSVLGLAIGPAGIYVSDGGNGRIRVLTP